MEKTVTDGKKKKKKRRARGMGKKDADGKIYGVMEGGQGGGTQISAFPAHSSRMSWPDFSW